MAQRRFSLETTQASSYEIQDDATGETPAVEDGGERPCRKQTECVCVGRKKKEERKTEANYEVSV
jgi:hypothetical protein